MQWSEKYRPTSVKDVVGQDHITGPLLGFIEDIKGGKRECPNFFFFGPPGTGKTTLALAFCRDIFGESWRAHVVEMNASDENSIKDVREKIKATASFRSLDGSYNVIVLDEVDYMSNSAQAALRRIMETSPYTIFILIANDYTRVMEAIRERCVFDGMRFRRLKTSECEEVLRRIIKKEGLIAEDKAVRMIALASKGSARKAISLLQTCVVGEALKVDNVKRLGVTRSLELVDVLYGRVKGQAALSEIESSVYECSRGSGNVEDLVYELVERAEEDLDDGRYRDFVKFCAETVYRCSLVLNPEFLLSCRLFSEGSDFFV